VINLTARYPNTVFQSVASTQLINQVNSINASGIPNLNFSKKYLSANIGTSPDGRGARTSQIDTLINSDSTYAFQNLAEAKAYALQAAAQMVNNATVYVENTQPTYYQIIVWTR